MYVSKNFKTKKAVQEAVAKGEQLTVRQNGIGPEPPLNGAVFIEGPWYPEPHKWYGQAVIKDGYIIKVK